MAMQPDNAEGGRAHETLGQRYRRLDRLGAGGMCEVWRARDTATNEIVTIKHLTAGDLSDPGRRVRLQEEGRLLARLDDGRMPRLIGSGIDARWGTFLVLRYVEGVSLAGLIKSSGPLPLAEAAFVLRELGLVLARAHDSEVIHRDIKASNVIVGPAEGVPAAVHLIDFGIARDQTPCGLRITRPGQFLGSPSCVAPEQIRGETLDSASVDVWAFGVLAYRLLARRDPFPARTVAELVSRTLRLPALPMPSRFLVTPALRPVADEVARCLHRERDRRAASVCSLVRALAPLATLARPDWFAAALTGRADRSDRDTTALTVASRPPRGRQGRGVPVFATRPRLARV